MGPWSLHFSGSKQQIAEQITGAPAHVAQAIRLLMEPLSAAPGWTEPDPAESWATDVPHTDKDVPPPKRSELWKTRWKVTASGNPEAHGVTEIRIEPIYEAVK